jgi:orotate phosphoribosyltransferase
MDRQEKSPSGISTIQEIKKDFNVPVLSIITLEEIIKFLVVAKDPDLQKHLKNIEAYQEQYAV